MLMSAGFAGPIVTHAALVNVPREPGSNQPGAAIGAMVNSLPTHASSHIADRWNETGQLAANGDFTMI